MRVVVAERTPRIVDVDRRWRAVAVSDRKLIQVKRLRDAVEIAGISAKARLKQDRTGASGPLRNRVRTQLADRRSPPIERELVLEYRADEVLDVGLVYCAGFVEKTIGGEEDRVVLDRGRRSGVVGEELRTADVGVGGVAVDRIVVG